MARLGFDIEEYQNFNKHNNNFEEVRANYERTSNTSFQQPDKMGSIAAAAGIQAGGNAFSSFTGGMFSFFSNRETNSNSLNMNSQTNSLKKAMFDKEFKLNQKKFDFEKQTINREWDAARSLGLASPAMMNGLGNGAYLGKLQGGRIVNTLRTPSRSPYSL